MPVPPRNILCVLAGGRSSRFGGSKLHVTLAGEPILAWQARRLLGAVGKVIPGRAQAWLSLAPDKSPPPGSANYQRRLSDPRAYRGPLAAMDHVLHQAHRQDTVAFVPADMPLLSADDLQRLAQPLADDASVVGVMGRWADGPDAGRVEPFPSIWRAGAGRDLLEWLAKTVGAPKHLADAPGVVCVQLSETRDALAWSSINYPSDLVVVATALGVPVEVV